MHRVALAAAASSHWGWGWTRTHGGGWGRAVSLAAEPRAVACLFSVGVPFSVFAPLSSLCLDAVFQMCLCPGYI